MVIRGRQKPDFNAKMTNRQIRSIRLILDKNKIYDDMKSLGRVKRLNGKSGSNISDVEQWMLNGWSTEYLLSHNSDLSGDALQASVHWAFPQAYYSIYAHIQSLTTGLGLNDNSHSSIRRRFGEWIKNDKYPHPMSFYADGSKYNIEIKNLKGRKGEQHSMWFENKNGRSHDHQVSQFLSSTRKIHLDKQREKMRAEFTTKKGSVRKRLTKKHWDQVSDSLGPTTLIDVLYRKRIKSNYRNVDTFHSTDLKPRLIIDGLKHIVECCNFVHECLLISLFGKNKMLEMTDEAQKSMGIDLSRRVEKAIDVCYS